MCIYRLPAGRPALPRRDRHPSRDATVSGATAVQVRVPADAQGTGKQGQGLLLGRARTAPFTIFWATGWHASVQRVSVNRLHRVQRGQLRFEVHHQRPQFRQIELNLRPLNRQHRQRVLPLLRSGPRQTGAVTGEFGRVFQLRHARQAGLTLI
jgi:hypothetical protein